MGSNHIADKFMDQREGPCMTHHNEHGPLYLFQKGESGCSSHDQPGSGVNELLCERVSTSRGTRRYGVYPGMGTAGSKDGYVCGWCEFDEDSQWLILVPHPLSSASSRRWKYGTEVEILGRVMSVVIRLGD
jgi:hypothetical protein